MSWFSELFAAEDDVDVATARAQEVAQASEVLDVADRPYFVRLMNYLDNEADRPVVIGGDKMLESAVRANTFKELRSKIRRDIQSAQTVLEEVKHGR